MNVVWSLLGLAAALLVADYVATRVVATRAGAALGQRLDAPTSVDVRSWPALVALVRAGVTARILASRVPLPGREGTVDVLDVHLEGVRLDGRRVTARTGRFTAHLGEQTLAGLAPVPGLRSVEVTADAVRFTLPGGVAVAAQVEVDDAGDLVLSPAAGGPLGVVRIAAPVGPLPFDARLESVEARPGELLLRGQLPEVALDLRT